MRSTCVVLSLLAASALLISAADAQQTPADSANAAARGARYHRLMADLIEAKAAPAPDQAEIDRLTDELCRLQDQLKAQQAGQQPAAQPGRGRGPGAGRQAGQGAAGRGPLGAGRGWQGGRGAGRQAGPGAGWRGGRGAGGPGGPPSDAAFVEDRDMFHYLLARRDAIERHVENIEGGVRTTTESDDPEVAATIQRHVRSMHKRIEQRRPIHLRDPLFAAVFAHADKIRMEVEPTDKGVRVVETSSDPYAARLIQAHAEVVNLFVANGFAEVHRNHALPVANGSD